MSKSILVIDTPTCCNECSLMCKDEYSYFCPVRCDENKTDIYDDYIKFHKKPSWCPLKPLPQKRIEGGTWMMSGYSADDFVVGYNVCINEILGE